MRVAIACRSLSLRVLPHLRNQPLIPHIYLKLLQCCAHRDPTGHRLKGRLSNAVLAIDCGIGTYARHTVIMVQRRKARHTIPYDRAPNAKQVTARLARIRESRKGRTIDLRLPAVHKSGPDQSPAEHYEYRQGSASSQPLLERSTHSPARQFSVCPRWIKQDPYIPCQVSGLGLALRLVRSSRYSLFRLGYRRRRLERNFQRWPLSSGAVDESLQLQARTGMRYSL